jgi:hypothetical protein
MAKRRAGATKRWAVARAVEWAFVGLELPFYSARWMRRAKYLTQEFFLARVILTQLLDPFSPSRSLNCDFYHTSTI